MTPVGVRIILLSGYGRPALIATLQSIVDQRGAAAAITLLIPATDEAGTASFAAGLGVPGGLDIVDTPPGQTTAAAINAAAAQAVEEFFVVLRAGDVLEPAHLADSLHAATRGTAIADAAYGSAPPFCPEASDTIKYEGTLTYDRRDEYAHLLRQSALPCYGTLLRRSSFLACGGLRDDYRHFAWLDFFFRFTAMGAVCAYTPVTAAANTAAADDELRLPDFGRLPAAACEEFLAIYEAQVGAERFGRISGAEMHAGAAVDLLLTQYRSRPANDRTIVHEARLAEIRRRLLQLKGFPGIVFDLKRPCISVVFPTATASAAKIFRALQSLQAQSFGDFEVVVVHGGGVPVQVHFLALELGLRLRYYHTPLRHVGNALRNMALRLASGTLITYLDDATVFAPQHLERIVHRLTASECDLIYTDAAVRLQRSGSSETGVLTLPQAYLATKMRLTVTPSLPLPALAHKAKISAGNDAHEERLPLFDDWLHALYVMSNTTLNRPLEGASIEIHHDGSDHEFFVNAVPFAQALQLHDFIYSRVPVTDAEKAAERARQRERFVRLETLWDAPARTLEETAFILTTLTGQEDRDGNLLIPQSHTRSEVQTETAAAPAFG